MKLKLILAMGIITVSLTACNSNENIETVESDACTEIDRDEFDEVTQGMGKPVIYLYPEESETCTKSKTTNILEEFNKATQGQGFKKPIIYLYNNKENGTNVKVSLKLKDSSFTCVYPSFNSGENTWDVTAFPNGDIIIGDKTYNYLYWEAENYKDWNFVPEYCVKGSDTATFLESKLAELGLTEHEANEFIIYWLPRMESNNYNLISFNTDEYEQRAELTTIPKSDTMIRVFMTFKASDKAVETNEPAITTPSRQGFTVVEWGGSEVK